MLVRNYLIVISRADSIEVVSSVFRNDRLLYLVTIHLVMINWKPSSQAALEPAIPPTV